MRVYITHHVPVDVLVDTETGEVERVIVNDEEVKIDEGDCISTEEFGEVEDPAVLKRAVKILDEAMWPAWEFGF